MKVILLRNKNNIRKNLFHYYNFLSQSDTVIPFSSADIFGFASKFPISFLNPVVERKISLSAIQLKKYIDDIFILHAKKNGKTIISWWSQLGHQSLKSAHLLESRGFRHVEGTYGMLVQKEDIRNVPKVEGLQIQRVLSSRDLRLWSQSACLGFELPTTMTSICSDLFSSVGKDDTLSTWIGFIDGRPVGTAQMFISENTGGIYWVSTIPELRRHGIAKALTNHAMQFAIQHGVSMFVLHATPVARTLYAKLGFQECVRMEHYVYGD